MSGKRLKQICPICDRLFMAYQSEIKRGSGRYCGYACKAEAAKRRIPAKRDLENPRAPTVARTCKSCLKTFYVYPYRATTARPARFCSDDCRLTRPAYRLGPRS